MSNKTEYEGTRAVRTFVDLSHSTNVLILKSKQEEKGCYHTTMAAILMTAFTFEAYLNHLGEMKIKFWDQIELVSVMKKKVDPDSDPYDHTPKTEWEEFCNLGNAEKSKNDVEKIITELHIAAGLGDYPFINGMSIGSMRRK